MSAFAAGAKARIAQLEALRWDPRLDQPAAADLPTKSRRFTPPGGRFEFTGPGLTRTNLRLKRRIPGRDAWEIEPEFATSFWLGGLSLRMGGEDGALHPRTP